jgi:hypothetical protein
MQYSKGIANGRPSEHHDGRGALPAAQEGAAAEGNDLRAVDGALRITLDLP